MAPGAAKTCLKAESKLASICKNVEPLPKVDNSVASACADFDENARDIGQTCGLLGLAQCCCKTLKEGEDRTAIVEAHLGALRESSVCIPAEIGGRS